MIIQSYLFYNKTYSYSISDHGSRNPNLNPTYLVRWEIGISIIVIVSATFGLNHKSPVASGGENPSKTIT